MPSAKSLLFLFSLAIQCVDLVPAVPLSNSISFPPPGYPHTITARKLRKQNKNQNQNQNNAAAASNGAKVSKAKDGSTIIDDQVVINGLNMRFKISAPASELVADGQAAGNGTLGLNILFHGDGGQSFVDFPNQGVNSGLMGIALLAPDKDFRWGGSDPRDNTGLVRPDGPAHSAAVNELITKVLPTRVNFDATNIFLEGVSGGSLLLSGFMIPTFAASLAVPGAVLGCGGIPPQVDVQGDISNLRLHFQSTTDDLSTLQKSIPETLIAYEKLIANPDTLTADASPKGGHCEFDEKDFVSGVQLLTDNFAPILIGDGELNGVAVANDVVAGKEDLFAANKGKANNAQGNQGNDGKNNNNNNKNAGNGNGVNGSTKITFKRA